MLSEIEANLLYSNVRPSCPQHAPVTLEQQCYVKSMMTNINKVKLSNHTIEVMNITHVDSQNLINRILIYKSKQNCIKILVKLFKLT